MDLLSRPLPFLTAVLASALFSLPARAETEPDYLVLEAGDPAGDQKAVGDQAVPGSGGDLRGTRLVLRKIPVARGPQTAGTRPEWVYLPVELSVRIETELTGGEVQLCIFIHLPPIDVEHIISRDSLLREGPSGEERILLVTRSEVSFFTGMEERWDDEVTAFKNSPLYPNCFFDAPPEERAAAFREAGKFAIHRGSTYRFPSSPTFYWRDIPPLTISTSLIVRELDGLTVRGFRGLVNDTMEADWKEVTGT
ncbi:MAG: hypothetical protein V1789_04385 [PVC group bacterium]